MQHLISKSVTLIFLFLTFLPCRADHGSSALGLGSGVGAPIATGSGITLKQGQISVGLRNEYIRFNDFSDRKLKALREADEDADLHSVESLIVPSISAAYGVTDDFSVGLQVPYIFRNNIREPEHQDGGEPEVVDLGDAEGLGDIRLFGQYRFFHDPESNTHVSAVFGVKAPTGRTNRRSDVLDDGDVERLEAELQPGSGSWDGFAGLAFTKQVMDGVSFDTNVLYTLVTKGSQHTDLGNIFSYNLSLAYQIGSDGSQSTFGSTRAESLGSSFKDSAIDLVLEMNGEWRDKEKTRGSGDDNSGGNLIYISPGIRFRGNRYWSVAVSYGIPILKDLNGDQVNNHHRIISSINFSF